MVGLGVLGMLASSLTYMAKDYNYYNILYRFFNVSRETSLILTRWPISQAMLLRLLNLSNVLFYLGFFQYAAIYAGFHSRRWVRRLGLFVSLVALVQVLFLDPSVCVFLYMKKILCWGDTAFYRSFYRALVVALRLCTIGICVFSFAMIAVAFFRTPRPMRFSVSLMLAIYGALLASDLYLYRWMPVHVIWMSRVAQLVIFQSLPVGKNYGIARMLPEFSVILVVGLAALTVHQILIFSSEIRETKSFNKKISEADTVSRVFCHYIKNEVLAQQAELRLLETKAPPELQACIKDIVSRNENMYAYLNNARQIFKQKKSTQEILCLKTFLEDVADSATADFGCRLEVQLPPETVCVPGNRYQLKSMFMSLIRNACEAPRGRNPFRLKMQVSLLHQYVRISIANNGQRIDKKNRKRVFEPFYSTKPSTSNWGLGLALCKNIAILHHGKIILTEETDHTEIFTVFQVILPLEKQD